MNNIPCFTIGKTEKEIVGHIGFSENVTVNKNLTRRVLITGANSYIGESFKKYAEKHYPNLRIDIIDMLVDNWKHNSFSAYDIVFHVAGLAHSDVDNADDKTKEKYYSVNTHLAIDVAKKSMQDGAKTFVFMSSMIVYGDSFPYKCKKIIDKDTIPNPCNFYGDSKLQADIAIRELACDSFKVIVLRPPMIYGKNSKGNYLSLSKIAKKLFFFPDVDNQRSMLYIENLCELVCEIMLIEEIKENEIVLLPQNSEWVRTSVLVEKIRLARNLKTKLVAGLIKNAISVFSKLPGRIGKLTNKAFGNYAYDLGISDYPGINYRVVEFEESIRRTENIKNDYIDRYFIGNTYKNTINVFLIGLRGYTQNYGGWESFAHGLLDNWQDKSVHFFAFEKVKDPSEETIIEVNGITCIRVFEKEQGSSAMIKYDRRCTDIACECIKKYSINNPILFHLGVRIGPYLYFKRKSIRNLGIHMIENPAGAEWRRTKWNKFVQVYLWLSAILMAKSTDCMACDNEGIKELYMKLLRGKKPIMEYVAYGVEKAPVIIGDMPERVQDYFNKWNIEKDGYYLILGRFVPENNYEMMFKGFIKSNTKRKLLVICNYQTEIPKFYEHIVKSTNFEKDSRIIMAGTLYDKEILHYIRQYAHGYIHGHSVGGTNPGLLEAMAETDINILYNVNFNQYVGGNEAFYFGTENELSSVIDVVDGIENNKKIDIGIKAKNRMKSKYSWSHIVFEYNRIFHNLVENKI